jgi:DNA-binding HxlR family transcriptional regulator
VLCIQPARLNYLKRRLGGIAHRARSEELKRLVRNGLISRNIVQTQLSGASMQLCNLGCRLCETFAALANGSVLERERSVH